MIVQDLIEQNGSEDFSDLTLTTNYLYAYLAYKQDRIEVAGAERFFRDVLEKSLRNLTKKKFFLFAKNSAFVLSSFYTKKNRNNERINVLNQFNESVNGSPFEKESRAVSLNMVAPRRDPFPFRRLKLILKYGPQGIADTFVKLESLRGWLTEEQKNVLTYYLGLEGSGSSVLSYSQPAIFFSGVGLDISALQAFLDEKACFSYTFDHEQHYFRVGEVTSEGMDRENKTLLSAMTVLKYQSPWSPVQVLLKAKANPDSGNALYSSSKYGSIEDVKALLDFKAHINQSFGRSGTALVAASKVNRLAVVKLLLSQKANTQFTLDDGTTSLYYAAQRGYAEVCKVLAEAKADVNVQEDFYQASPLHIATDRSHLDVVNVLIDSDADLNLRSNNELSPLIVAARKEANRGNPFLKVLMDAKANPNFTTQSIRDTHRDPHTALSFAFLNRNEDGVRILLNGPIAVAINVRRSSYCLCRAVHNGWPDILRELLQDDVSSPERPKNYPSLHIALRHAVVSKNFASLLELSTEKAPRKKNLFKSSGFN